MMVLAGFMANAQINAVTENGDPVFLYEDGTWQYVSEENPYVEEIPVNEAEFEKEAKSSFLLKSKKTPLGFWLDPKKWTFKKGVDNADAEYELQLKEGDLYGMIITEQVEFPLLP